MSKICTCRRILVLVAVVVIFVFLFKVLFSGPSNSIKIGDDGLPLAETDRSLNLTESQRAAFNNFKVRVSGAIQEERYLKEDVFLIKWLEAADFDAEEAERLLVENLEWKVSENISSIHDEDWSDMRAEYEYNLYQVDFIGRPVLYIPLEDWDVKEATSSGRQERLERYITKMMDEAVNLVYQKYDTSKNITQYWILVELEDFSIFQGACIQCISVYLKLARTFEEKYPRMGSQIILINTPGVFSLVYSAIRPVLSEHTKNNVHLLGDREEWEPILMKFGVEQIYKNATEDLGWFGG